MKRYLMIAVAITVSLLFSGAAFAADKEHAEKSHAKVTQSAESLKESGNFLSANRFIGWNVNDQRGEDVGEVQDLLVDRNSGKISYVIISKGGFLGVGDERYTVPFSAFKTNARGDALTLNTDASKLTNAPEHRAGMSEQEYGRQLNEHYGLAPSLDESEGQQKMRQESPEKKSHEMHEDKEKTKEKAY